MKPTKTTGLLSLQVPTQNAGAVVTNASAPKEYLNIQEAADLLRICIRTVYRLNKKGLLPKAKIGNSVMYPQDLLREYIRNCALNHLKNKDW